jgi:hypothetical protein
LITKFTKPYIDHIPEILRYLLSLDQQEKLTLTKNIVLSELDNLIIMNNIIENLLVTEDKYFFTKNFFEINFIEIDNMADRYPIKFKIESLFQKKLKYDKIYPDYVIYDEDVKKIKEEKNQQDEYESGFKINGRSFNDSTLPTNNLFNRNKFLNDLLDKENENENNNKNKIKQTTMQMKEKFNLRLVYIFLLLKFLSNVKLISYLYFYRIKLYFLIRISKILRLTNIVIFWEIISKLITILNLQFHLMNLNSIFG